MLVCHSQLIFNVKKIGREKYFVYLQLNAGEPVVQLTSTSPKCKSEFQSKIHEAPIVRKLDPNLNVHERSFIFIEYLLIVYKIIWFNTDLNAALVKAPNQ